MSVEKRTWSNLFTQPEELEQKSKAEKKVRYRKRDRGKEKNIKMK